MGGLFGMGQEDTGEIWNLEKSEVGEMVRWRASIASKRVLCLLGLGMACPIV